jgi:hypothetical protein
MRSSLRLATALFAAAGAAPCTAQLRVMQWNVTNYQSGRTAEFQTALYASFNARAAAPDVIIAEEINSSTGAANFRNLLNAAPNSPGDWALAPFVPNSGDSSNALFYRTSRITSLGVVTLNQGTGPGPGMPPRDNQRWHVRLFGFASPRAELFLYASHMKAGSTGADRDRRTPEAQRLRNNSNALPPTSNFILGGDFNIQSWNENAYQILIAPAADPDGRFIDPIKSPGYLNPSPTGSWNNNNAYRFIHTQDPATCDTSCSDTDCNGGGMDDRLDQLLISASLTDGNGLDYIGNTNIPYSSFTWNDPNHSYRVWGNDGSRYNCRLATTTNTMVGPLIAQAIVDSCNGQGHLPVFLDLQIPAVAAISPDAVIDFGEVRVGASAQRTITIANATSVSRWSRTGNGAGIDDLDYTLAAAPVARFSAPAGAFAAPAGVPGNTHTITLNTSVVGDYMGTLTMTSDDPDNPTRLVTLAARVIDPVPACACDWNASGVLDSQDFFDYLGAFFAGDADFNADTSTNSQDFFDFLACFFKGC